MFSSAKRSTVRSTVASTRSTAPRKNEGFVAFIIRRLKEMFMGLWGYSRKFLWVSTTGNSQVSQD